MPLGMAFSSFVVLAVCLAFAWYAKRTPGVQTFAFFWGGIVFSALTAMAVEMSGFDLSKSTGLLAWPLGILHALINPPIQPPEWFVPLAPAVGPVMWTLVGLGVVFKFRHTLKPAPPAVLGNFPGPKTKKDK